MSLTFTSPIIPGRGRGSKEAVPTLNLDPSHVPTELEHGIYACHTIIEGHQHDAVMHYGLRPTFHDTESCEVHLLDGAPENAPEKVEVIVAGFLRDVQQFDSPQALKAQIEQDINAARAMLAGT